MSGYTPLKCKPEIIHFPNKENWESADWENQIGQFVDAKAVAWYYDSIIFYNIQDEKWNQPLREGMDELVRIRVFDENKELHIWRSNGKLKGRLRTDSKGDEIEYVEARQIMNGTRFKEKGDGIIASEEKGTLYELPYPALKRINENGRIILVSRNYIDYNDIGQAGYVDSRFVNIETFK